MVINMPSEIDFKYHNYVAESTILEIIYDMEISEICSMLNESSMDILNEQEQNVNRIKDTLNVLIENISKLFAQFVDWAKRKVRDDSGFLRYYRKTLTQTPLIEDTYTMYPYWQGMNEILSATVPNFNYFQLKNDLETDEDFIDAHFSKYVSSSSKSRDVVAGAKKIFRGNQIDPIPVKSSSIPMQKLYNFCVDYENIVKVIESDLRKLDKSAKECIKYANRIHKENAKKSEAKEQFSEQKLLDEIILVNYITETGVEIKSKVDKANSNADGSTRYSVRMNNVKDSSRDDTDNKSSIDTEDPLKDVQRIKRYLKICSNFLGAKLAVLQEQYNAYMYIFRHHVNTIKLKSRQDKAIQNENDKKQQDTSADPKGSSPNEPNNPTQKNISLFGKYRTKLKS